MDVYVLVPNISSACFSGAGVAQPPTDSGPWGGRILVEPLVERNVAPGGRGPGTQALGRWEGLPAGSSACGYLGFLCSFWKELMWSRTDAFLAQKQNPEPARVTWSRLARNLRRRIVFGGAEGPGTQSGRLSRCPGGAWQPSQGWCWERLVAVVCLPHLGIRGAQMLGTALAPSVCPPPLSSRGSWRLLTNPCGPNPLSAAALLSAVRTCHQ